MVSIVVQPPTETQTGRAIYPPVVAQTRVRAGGRHDNTHLFATTALLDANGNVLDGHLSGAVIATGCPVEDRPAGTAGGGRYQDVAFAFPDLVLMNAGVFSLRVDVYRVSYEGGDTDNATMIDQAETELFYALTNAVAPQMPYCGMRSLTGGDSCRRKNAAAEAEAEWVYYPEHSDVSATTCVGL